MDKVPRRAVLTIGYSLSRHGTATYGRSLRLRRGLLSTFGSSLLSEACRQMEKTEPLSADTLAPGQWEHPDYVIKRELGRGGMGIVYLAHNTLMGRDEVLKVIGLQIMTRPGTLERFLREIRSIAKLRHPNIVTAYHATRLAERIVFSMEYVEGLDLARLVKANGPLPLVHACDRGMALPVDKTPRRAVLLIGRRTPRRLEVP